MNPEAALDQGLSELTLALDPSSRKKLLAYLELLEKWNRTYNLTAVRDPLKMVTHHLLDSLAVLRYLPSGRLADIGAGGGLPGIPIAIAEPERPIVLNDSNEKKAAFLRQAGIALALGNVAVHLGRCTEWRPAERFRVVISRGFAELSEFVSACRHLVAPGGSLVAMKGVHPSEELARVPADVDCGEVLRLNVPLLGAERHLVLCRAKE